MLVTGISGGGKSVFVNKLVHHLVKDHPTVILDKGGSFKRVTLYHGGTSLEHGINPLHFRDPIYLRELILSICDKNIFDKLKQGQLLKEIKELLPSVSSFFELIEKLEIYFDGLTLYFEDIKDFFHNRALTECDLLYVDIDHYPKNIVSPLIIYLLEYFKNIKAKNKILVFDECWNFLVGHAEFIDDCFRTFRKTGAFPIAISQSLNDFRSLGRDLGSSITNNSYYKVFFPQEISSDGELSSFDIDNIKNLSFHKGIYSECYLKTADNTIRKTIRNYLTPLELELFHTEKGKDQKLYSFLERFERFFSNNANAIDSYVRLRHENSNDFYFANV